MLRAIMAGVVALGVSVSGALAQEEGAPQPRCAAPEYQAFSFWAGEWVVVGKDDSVLGTNTITIEEDGCVMVEHWKAANGSTGQSLSFYDPALRKWRQIWVSPSVVIELAGGPVPAGGMRLTGEIRYPDGRSAPMTGTWLAWRNRTVTQEFQILDPETGEWTEWFSATYKPHDMVYGQSPKLAE